jgi:hypothetical protein
MAEHITSGMAGKEERRREPRFPHQRVADCRIGPGNERMWVWLCDLSAGGVSLQASRRLALGTTLVVPLKAPGLPILELSARVVHCTPFGGGWRVGCRLATRLSDDRLRAILEAGSEAEAPAEPVQPERTQNRLAGGLRSIVGALFPRG